MANFFTGIEKAIENVNTGNTVAYHYENGEKVYRYICNSCGEWTLNYVYEPWEDDNGGLICISCLGRCQEWRREVGLTDVRDIPLFGKDYENA